MRTRRLAAAASLAVLLALTTAATEIPIAVGWGAPSHADEFDGNSLDSTWAVYDSPGNGGNGLRRPSQVSVADGRMTQTGTADGTSAGMVLDEHFQRYGRWEIRAQVAATGEGHPYHPVLALIPGGDAPYHCGATDIDFAESDIGGPTYIFIHALPNIQDYLSVRIDQAQWHTYGVEVTPDHITWFVDGVPMMTDTNRDALSGVDFAVNIQLDANDPGGLAPAQLAVDYVRIYPLRGPAPAIPAPGPSRGTYDGAC